ncbi:hypothetical protein PMIN01_03883 [Paraphaeosphaeria minitans]|uniref:Uncharacterized protein n=1 Tax=Paraphaeosphaeria minitans TaxID=565426 RepID=A0A9P6GP85_9PLEO|nr:hypothetical protein PMIN01_03883 [Paraphaeosphaeria minitans]
MPSSKPPADNPAVMPDPNQNDSTIRKAFLLEAIANLFTIPLITNTRFILSILLLHPSDINPASILFARLFGGIIVGGLTSALLIGAGNTRNGIGSRRTTYVLLGLGEAFLIPMLALETAKGGSDAALSTAVAVGSIGLLLPPLAWRGYVLFLRPELLGRYRKADGGKGRAGAGVGGSGTKCE